jgi:beta-glucosidase
METKPNDERGSLGRQHGDVIEKAADLVSRMSIEEQALLLSGDGWWRTHGIERLGVAPIGLSDGPHGLRKAVDAEGLGMVSVPATCFPTAPALAATWNTGLLREVGAALGREAQAADVQVLLGPGVNIKRSPLGGRNFEYFSEDPLLAGRMAAAYINGVQGEGVGTSLKHFAANSQETERMSTSSDVDERTLHEIYLPAFEIAVREAQPWTVMSAYNLVNGTYAAEHQPLLTGILREQWGFEGLVVSDWGGINDRVRGVEAGNDLEMPGSGHFNRNKIIAAVHEGRLSKQALARSATAMVALSLKATAARRPGSRFDAQAHHALARRACGEAIVLLKNADNMLPLPADSKLAVIGSFAKMPRYQGAGSSQVNPIQVTNAYDELAALVGAHNLVHAQGCDGEGDTTDALLKDAALKAASAGGAVVFVGLPESYESEGFDRQGIDLPAGHVQLIEAVAQAQPNLVVVLLNGSAVAMPWAGRAKGIVEAWLGGQAGGGAIADVLCGRVNPSGKLSETFAVSIEQTPTFPHFPGRAGHAVYGEGLFVGYRYYDAKRLEPLFPFGFGLSYTRFTYTAIRSSSTAFDADGGGLLTIDVSVQNVGAVAGQEVVQLYVHERMPAVVRPVIELRAFDKVALEPGEQKTLRFTLGRRDFATYDARAKAWRVNPGTFDVRVGGSSRDLPLQCAIDVQSRQETKPLTRQSVVREVKGLADGEACYAELVRALGFGELLDPAEQTEDMTPDQIVAQQKARTMAFAFVDEMPLNKVPAFSLGCITEARLDEIIRRA